MPLPTFNSFALNDENFIAERITFKGYADRAVTRAKINRREGIKLLGTEFGEKIVTITGYIVADSASDLQSKVDDLKKNLSIEEGDLVIETGRTWKATVESLAIPDEHYNQSAAPFEVTFVCSNPYAEGATVSASIPVPSGQFTISGTYTISGTFFNRPTIVYTPAGAVAGNTNINRLQVYHVPTGQTITISGFGSGLGLSYANPVTVNLDTFSALEGAAAVDTSGAFPKWEPGTNQFTLTSTGRFPGGTITVSHKPRYV